MCAGRCGCCPAVRAGRPGRGDALSSVSIGPRSPLAFQGTPDDARTLLLGITGTMITVIALLLGLTVVALQLSSTQFSPRLLRSFLRDRPNQVVLSAFVATFAYSAAGLYTVGVSGGNRTAAFPGSRSAARSCCCSSAWDCSCSSPTTSALDPGRRDHGSGPAQHPGGDRGRIADRRPGSAGDTGLGRAGRVRAFGIRPGGTSAGAAAVCRPARCLPAPAAPGRRARGRRHGAGVDLACLPGTILPRTAGLLPGAGQPGSGSGSSAP